MRGSFRGGDAARSRTRKLVTNLAQVDHGNRHRFEMIGDELVGDRRVGEQDFLIATCLIIYTTIVLAGNKLGGIHDDIGIWYWSDVIDGLPENTKQHGTSHDHKRGGDGKDVGSARAF